MRKSQFQKNQRKTTFLIVMGIILLVYSITLLFPLLWAIFSSLKTDLDFTSEPFGLSPYDGLQFGNIIEAFRTLSINVITKSGDTADIDLLHMLAYSVIYSVGVAFVSNFTRSLCAYVCARYQRVRFTKWIYGLVIVLMTISFPSNLSVTIDFWKMVGIYDNMFMTIITSISFGGANFLYLYAAYVGLSQEYSEAAQIDGANQFQVMFSVMMPMVKNIFVALFMLDFIACWNDYMPNVVNLRSYPMLAYGLYGFQQKTPRPSIPLQLSSSTLVILPTLAIFIIFKDKIMSNLSIGGLKG